MTMGLWCTGPLVVSTRCSVDKWGSLTFDPVALCAMRRMQWGLC
jgi:hypothetical protein